MKLLPLPNKRLRAEVIYEYYGEQRLYCFSCGNATQALEEIGCDVISITPETVLGSNGYIDPVVSDYTFSAKNVTSGCLPLSVMQRLSVKYFLNFDPVGDDIVYVPCGSGETLFALSFFVPLKQLRAVTSDFPPLQFDSMSPLYSWVKTNVPILDVGKQDSILNIIKSIGPKKNSLFIDTRNQGLKYND